MRKSLISPKNIKSFACSRRISGILPLFSVCFCMIFLLLGCSTKKNTAMSRQWQALNTRYNVYYNGDEHYKETLKAMEQAYEDDYTRLLLTHPAEARADNKLPQPSGDFKRTIEKMQKAIQLHSIKKKPAKKNNSQKEKEFRARDEFNPFLHNAWMMLGKAQYQNGDFLGAASTFFYISKHFTWLPEIVTEARLWQARSYCAMDWDYEAENVLHLVKEKQLTSNSLRNLYNLVEANYLIRVDKFAEAVPYLENAAKSAKGSQKNRLYFLLGQVYARLGKNKEAYAAYDKAGKGASTMYRTKFNARIKRSDVDIVPVGSGSWAVRPYGMDDPMRGPLADSSTRWLGSDYLSWSAERALDISAPGMPEGKTDIQASPIYPVVSNIDDMEKVLRWMISEPTLEEGKRIWFESPRLSADGISAEANLERLYAQRQEFRRGNWTFLAGNFEKSVFYQLDLADAAENYNALGLPAPAELSADVPAMTRIRNHMLRSRIATLGGADGSADERKAFGLLRSEVLAEIDRDSPRPYMSVYPDQIVWGRSSVRIDLAGGWTDTPPYSLYSGGNVVNMAIELNGQPPIQVYVKPSKDFSIVLRSIDLGAMEVVKTFEELQHYHTVGSPFSIPKAALTLAGFVARTPGDTLSDYLHDFGAGIEVTLLSAIPAGSGLGTSSILGSTVLGALSDFCGLAWDENEICYRTLALEQLLTTGGGWQDQYGGALPGIKLLQTSEGYDQRPLVSWLPQQIFTSPDHRQCHLLYYTGITRTAKGILAEIVRGMFLNSGEHLAILSEMKSHAVEMARTIQRGNFEDYGRMVAETWRQNKRLDSGTEPEAVAAMIRRISDWTLGCKLPGAGGGGYLYMVAKDPEAAALIRAELCKNPPNPRARFVEMSLSDTGFQSSRS